MTTDLQQSQQIVNPRTGEALTLDSDTSDLAQYLDDIREFRNVLMEADRYVSRELIRRLDADAKWTKHVPGFKVSGPSPAPKEEWDGVDLYTELSLLVDRGVISIEAMNAAVETETVYKPKKAGINALRKLGGEARAVVDRLASSSEPDRNRVTVTRDA